MTLEILLRTATGDVVANLTRRLTAGALDTDVHGPAALSVTARMPQIADQLRYYDREGGLFLDVLDGGAPLWHGRLEEVLVGPGELTLTAYGAWRALSDARYTALWSATGVQEWETLTTAIASAYADQKHAFRKDTALYWTIKRGMALTNGGGSVAGMYYAAPDGGARDITAVALDYTMTLPNNWVLRVGSWTADFGAFTSEYTVTATGSPQSGSLLVPLAAARPIVLIDTYNNTGGTYTNTQDDGVWFVRIDDVRVTTNAFAVSTTLAANAAAGATSISVASAAGIVIGMPLYLASATSPERVTVTSIAGTTIGVSPLAGSKTSGATVRGQRVTAAEIAADLVATAAALNPAQLASAAAIASSTQDYADAQYADADPGEVLAGLATIEGQRALTRGAHVYVGDPDAAGFTATWHLEIDAVSIGRALDAVTNRVYPVYHDAANRTQRGAAQDDAASQDRWGVVRVEALGVQTTSSATAETLAGVALADRADPAPRVQIAVRQVRATSGMRVDPWRVAAGDVVVVPRLARDVRPAVDNLTVLRLARTSYDLLTNTLTVEAETPPDALDVLLAQPTPQALGPSPLQEALYALGRRYRPDLFR